MPLTKVNDIEMYYETHGKGTPIVIINGYGRTSEQWMAISSVITDLSKRYKVIIQDNRGVGRSTISDKPVTMKLMAEDIAALLDKIGIDDAYFIGNSMGGVIAQEIALNYPEKVLGLILSATSAGGKYFHVRDQFEKIKMLRWLFEPPKDLTAVEMMNIFNGLTWSPEYYQENHEMLNSYIPKYPALPSTLKRHYEATIMHDTCDRLEKISVKTLIIHGAQDGLLYPDSAYYFSEKIPNSELFIIEDARHGLLIEKWNLVSKKLEEFINL